MSKAHPKKGLGFWSAVAIGVGAMVGGGIFATLGLGAEMAKGGLPVAFLIAGIVAAVTSYSYARLSVTFPSRGGTVEFLNRAFGKGTFAGAMNVLLWMSYFTMISLHAYAFGSYGATFFPTATQNIWKHILITAVIVLFAVLNIVGAVLVTKSEVFIDAIKIIILLVFVGVGIWSINFGSMRVSKWSGPLSLIAGGMIMFVAYEGFELIANTASEARDPKKTLPRAYYSAIVFVIVLYIGIAMVTISNLPLAKIVSSRDYALAEAAVPFLGNAGFALVAIAALLATASAINATLYGSSRISYDISKSGELPKFLQRKVWNKKIMGLLIISFVTLLIANFLDIESIATMGSAGFLLIFGAANAANFLLYKKTQSRRWISGIGVILCVCAVGALVWHECVKHPKGLLVLVVMVGAAFAIEIVYKKMSGKSVRTLTLKKK